MIKENSPKRNLIAILSDFGEKDFYVGVMKGVILSINPFVEIVDITNNVERHNIIAGAFALYNSFNYFPKGTIFLAVVDPGVGTRREPILVVTNDYFFVAPNNGLVYPAAVENVIQRVVLLRNEEYFLKSVSFTFHGRDIFAPVAAHLSTGVKPENFGPDLPKDKLVKLKLSDYSKSGNGIVGKIIYIDVFGNVITSIPNKELLGLKFGTEIVSDSDGSLAALLGASPGASTSVSIMLEVLKKCFPKQIESKEWKEKLCEMIPTYGKSLINNPELCTSIRNKTTQELKLEA